MRRPGLKRCQRSLHPKLTACLEVMKIICKLYENIDETRLDLGHFTDRTQSAYIWHNNDTCVPWCITSSIITQTSILLICVSVASSTSHPVFVLLNMTWSRFYLCLFLWGRWGIWEARRWPGRRTPPWSAGRPHKDSSGCHVDGPVGLATSRCGSRSTLWSSRCICRENKHTWQSVDGLRRATCVGGTELHNEAQLQPWDLNVAR